MILCLAVFAAFVAGCGDDDDDSGDLVGDDGGDDDGGDIDAGDGGDDGGDDDAGPADSCCDPDERPGEGGTYPCIEGARCCADGTWRCNEGDGSSTCESAGGDCAGVACSQPSTVADAQCVAPAGP